MKTIVLETTVTILILWFFVEIIWFIATQIRRPERKSDFESYWDAFNEPEPCVDAWEYYTDGVHVHKKYGVTFQEIGCPDHAAFHTAAVHNLERALEKLYEYRYEQPGNSMGNSAFNDRAIKIRAGLASLKIANLDEESKKAYADKFVTVKPYAMGD